MLKRNQNELKMMIALWRKTVAAIVEWPYASVDFTLSTIFQKTT